jgi:hypothetical protein
MEPYHLLFEHKGEKIEASVEPWIFRAITADFQSGFFTYCCLSAWTKKEAETHSKTFGSIKYETSVLLTDKYDFHSNFEYKNGELMVAGTEVWKLLIDEPVTINPKRAFAFWTSLAAALRANPETPEQVKKNLEEIAQITSLDAYIEKISKEKKQTPEELFNEEYLIREMPDLVEDYLNPKYF